MSRRDYTYDKETDTYEVTKPVRGKEKLFQLYPYFVSRLESYAGRAPCRSSLQNYVNVRFPVVKGGPYIKVPSTTQLHRVMTSKEAMDRFFDLLEQLENELGIA